MEKLPVLVIDAEPGRRRELREMLAGGGIPAVEASGARTGLATLRKKKLRAVVLDLDLPAMQALSLLSTIHKLSPGLPVIVVTSRGDLDTAVEAMKRGARDLLRAPLPAARLVGAIEECLRNSTPSGSLSTPTSQAAREMEQLNIIARSRLMFDLYDTVKQVAPHAQRVLLMGESGTGKELIARALHQLSGRAAGPFIPVNCATLSDAILESDLFGHERGAFTSAEQMKIGVMETAHGGTLFLDEIDEMGIACQAKVLRVLERHEFRRVGGTKKIKIDVHLIAATNADLEQKVEKGLFRADLFYRLKVVTLLVPPLRQRREAIPVLVDRFLSEIGEQIGLPAKKVTADAMSRLVHHDWPGNIRELRNCLEGLSLTMRKPVIEASDLPASLRGSVPTEIRIPVGTRLEDAEREIIRVTLASQPTIKDCARVLGMGLRTLYTKMKHYGIGSNSRG